MNDVTTRTRYDDRGRVIEIRQPEATSGTDPGTLKTIYYSSGANPADAACGDRPEWESLVCKTGLASGVGGDTLPTSVFEYDAWGNVTTVVETSTLSGTPATRTTTTTYDAAGRATKTAVASTIPGSTSRPASTMTYSTTTGLLTKTGAHGSSAEVTRAYDGWGRPTSYTNDAGETTTTTYNTAGHVASTTDPTGSTNYTWGGEDANGKLERRPLVTKLTVSRGAGAGVLTYRGAWDAEGQLTRQSMPGGISLVNTYDAGGLLTDMTYTGQVTPVTENIDPDTGETTWTPGTPEADQPWLSWTRRYDIAGRVQAEWNGAGAAFDGVPGVSDPGEIGAPSAGQALAADKRYIYDFAGRLTRVDDRTAVESGVTLDLDTAADSQVPCTRREYSFDKNGNRTKSRTTSDAGGECFYAGGPVEVNHSYDGLDRPVKAGDGADYSYDAFGRQRVIPESDAPVPGAGDIDVSYFDDDLAHTISQNDVTTTFALDALGRRKTSTITGQPTQTRHYGDDSDNPAWLTNSDGMLTRMTASLDGLGAMVLGDGTAALALGNPHGDNVTTVVLAPAHPETEDAVSITGWIDYDEYGRSKSGAETGIGYGWLGKHERATSIESAGLTWMGVRLYNPVRGAFTTTDPVSGGNTTAYTYPQDPINDFDLTGQFCWKCKLVSGAAAGLKFALAKVACSATGLSYLLCKGVITGVVDGAAYLARKVWAEGKRLTAAIAGKAGVVATLGFLDGVMMGSLGKLKKTSFKEKLAMARAFRKSGSKAAAWLRSNRMGVIAVAVVRLTTLLARKVMA